MIDPPANSPYKYVDVSAGTDSRNYFYRGRKPDGLLFHTTDGKDSLDWLQRGSARAGRPASSDYLIAHDGTQYQIAPYGFAAYHAGDSAAPINGSWWQDDELSRRLIGIELEQKMPSWCTYAQLDSLAELAVYLAWVYDWRWPFVILRHGDVAVPPGRRLDPQGFEWGTFFGRLYAASLTAHIPGL